MEVLVYKNPKALRFVRCVSAIPGTDSCVGGAGITLASALARCESELVERMYARQSLWARGVYPVGIAAHVDFDQARSHALQEVIETLCLKEIHERKSISCLFYLRVGTLTFGLARTSHGYLGLARGRTDGQTVAAHSASPSLLGAIFKTWEEYCSIHFFKPQDKELRAFTKANRIFQDPELDALSFHFDPRFCYRPNLSAFRVKYAEHSGRKIAYFLKEENK